MSRDNTAELRRNTIILGIANIGSKAISFILAPLYSYFLSVEQYGTTDIILSTVSLLLPFVCLDIYEATFRYSNEQTMDRSKVLISSLAVCIPCISICILTLIVSILTLKSFVVSFTAIFVLFDVINDVLAQYLRGTNKMITYAVSGIIGSLVTLASNIILLVLLKYQLFGWAFSLLIAKACTTLYLCITIKIWRFCSYKNIDSSYIKTLLRFSLPLMPNQMMWWIMNSSDRYMLIWFSGAAATGLYAAGNKIPSLLSIFANIFYQAWQTTSINNFDKKNRDEYYSSVFNHYFYVLTIGVLWILLLAKPVMQFLFAHDYAQGYICMAPLVVGVLVHALGGNLGTLYVTFKKTTGAFYTTVVGAIANIGLNFFFIPKYGILGAAITTLIGYLVTLMVRWFDVRRLVTVKINYKKWTIYAAAIILQFLLYYNQSLVSYVIRSLIAITILINERKMIMTMVGIKRKV